MSADARGVQLSVRVDARVVPRADALLDRVSELIGHPARRADVLREALLLGLAELELRRDSPPRGGVVG